MKMSRLLTSVHHVRRLLDVGIRKIEALHHELLVLAQLLWRVRIDEHGVLVQHLALERVGEHRHADRVLDGRVAQRHARALVGAHVAVEHEVDAGGALQHLEDVPQRHLAQVERDRPRDARFELHGSDGGLHQPLVDDALQPPRLALLRVLGKHRAQHVLRLAVLAGLYELAGVGDEHAVAPVGLDLREARGGARAAAIVRLHTAVERFGLLIQTRLAHDLGLREPLCR